MATTKEQKDYRRTLGRLVDEFGADILVQWQEPLPMLTKDRIIKRLHLEAELQERFGDQAIGPAFSDQRLGREGRIAVIHPNPTAADRQELGRSRPARLVRQALREFGVPSQWIADMACTFTEAERPPSARELAESHRLMLVALDAADVSFVVLHGAQAVHQWRPDLKMEQVAGRMGLWRNRWWVMPIFHAAAVHRPQGVISVDQWKRHLQRFTDMVDSPDPFKHLSKSCVKCEGAAYSWDADGLPWCVKHWEEGAYGHVKGIKKERKARGAETRADQLTMKGM